MPKFVEHTCAVAPFEMKLEVWISTFAPWAKIAPPWKLHVPRQELERKFEIVLFAENVPMALKSSAN
jgi:hypothetical protein